MKMSLQNQTWTGFRRQGHVVKEELMEVGAGKTHDGDDCFEVQAG